MKSTISWQKCFDAYSDLNLIETEDGDIIIEVARDYEHVFEEEHFDVEVIFSEDKSSFSLEVHEGGYELSSEEANAIAGMVSNHLKSKQQ